MRFIKRCLKWYLVGIEEKKIVHVLQKLGCSKNKILLLHSSLSACGQIVGGSATVIEALRKWAPDKTLVLPTHTYCYPETGEALGPVFDIALTPSQVGAVSEYFRQVPTVVRSLHPTHSLAVSGPMAQEICKNHEQCDTPCGRGTPYERLIQNDCGVLMFGVSMNAYTFFHTAEDAVDVPYLYEKKTYRLRVRNHNGCVMEVNMRRQNMQFKRRFALMDKWLEDKGLLLRARLGLGEILLIPSAQKVHIAVTTMLKDDPFFLLAESSRLIEKNQHGI